MNRRTVHNNLFQLSTRQDWPTPRHKIRRGNFPYIFKITEDFTYQTDWQLEADFIAEWLEISKNGLITVKANKSGYSWDGCTPKLSILNLWVIGVPDGHVNYRTMRPYTYDASLVHDALYQYLDSVPIARSEIDRLFLQMLGDFKLRKLYYLAVRLFGGWHVVQKGIH
ncbi:hypothetical protein KDD30_08135 [Photobacterium sp. GJ3]|uniref:hypothetical protein n=1 Tax=Photobacterium sp. GJ3 TaxID=2829502 RepID=UPI001B8D9358|nr:hypothetical protein [Photobacterium sp. GJ3]QUJ66169.1 hypothetical protein KDD30_08135 [Photobacterium sp. GJ3]